MSLIQALTTIENELLCEAKRAAFLRDSHKFDKPRIRYFNKGFWSGNKQGLELAIEKLQSLKRLAQ